MEIIVKTMKRFKYILASTAIAAIMLSACSDSDDFAPGMPTNPDSPQVYFTDDALGTYMYSTGKESYTITINVGRVNDTDELIVPINILYADPALTVPTEVKFNAGESEASFDIIGKGLEQGNKYYFLLEFPEDMVNNYSTSLPGLSRLESCVLVADPSIVTVSANTNYYALGQRSTMEMMKLSETEYYFPDFLKTGKSMTIYTDPSSGEISVNSPLGSYDSYYSGFVIDSYDMYFGDNASTYATYMLIYYPKYSVYYKTETGEGICLSTWLETAAGFADYDLIYIEFPIDEE